MAGHNCWQRLWAVTLLFPTFVWAGSPQCPPGASPPLLDYQRLKTNHGSSCVEYRMVCVDQEALIVYDPAYASQAHAKNLPAVDLSKLNGWFRHKRHHQGANHTEQHLIQSTAVPDEAKIKNRRLAQSSTESVSNKKEQQDPQGQTQAAAAGQTQEQQVTTPPGTGSPPGHQTEQFAHSLELDVVAGTAMKLGPLSVRLPHAHEEGVEGGAPQYFSSCTLPIVIYQHWPNNLAEFSQRTVSWLHSWQNEMQPPFIDRNVTIVLGNFAKLPLEPFNTFLTQPFSRYSVRSFASFSSRLPSSDSSNATAEGRHVRCFQRLMVCAFENGKYPGLFDIAHNAMRYYQPNIPSVDGYWQQGSDVMRILFEVRPAAAARQMLNLDEIISWCASGGLTVPKNGIWKTVQCRKHVFGRNLLRDIAIASQADVLVSHHGAGQMNSLYMREYSSLLELRPYEFGTKFGWMPLFWWPMIGPQNGDRVMYWAVNLEDEKYYVASALEKHARSSNDSGLDEMQVVQSRHLLIPPHVLQSMIDKIVDTGRDASLYRLKYCSSQVLFTQNASGELAPTKLHPDFKC